MAPREVTPKLLYRRFVQEVLVRGNLTALDELVAADVVSSRERAARLERGAVTGCSPDLLACLR